MLLTTLCPGVLIPPHLPPNELTCCEHGSGSLRLELTVMVKLCFTSEKMRKKWHDDLFKPLQSRATPWEHIQTTEGQLASRVESVRGSHSLPGVHIEHSHHPTSYLDLLGPSNIDLRRPSSISPTSSHSCKRAEKTKIGVSDWPVAQVNRKDSQEVAIPSHWPFIEH